MGLLAAVLAGALAGYGVAIPVGAVAVLIIETGARRGPGVAAAAGLGAATADGIYATLAGVFGGAIAAALDPWAIPLRWLSVGLLVVIGGRGLAIAIRRRPELAPGSPDPAAAARSVRRTYLGFLGLTLLNPMTIAYFGALALGLPAVQGGLPERLAFAAAAFAASASWQLLVAAAGGLLHRHASPAAIRATSLVGNVVVLGAAAVVAAGLIGG